MTLSPFGSRLPSPTLPGIPPFGHGRKWSGLYLNKMTTLAPRYSLPAPLLMRILLDMMLGRHRSFGCDAQLLAEGVDPPPVIEGEWPTMNAEKWVLAANHFSRPGFSALWIAVALAAACPVDLHWMMTSAWVYPDFWRRNSFTPLSTAILRRLASCYGFTSMPPMPPRSSDTMARAQAVNAVLRRVREPSFHALAWTPEGRDSADGKLIHPPPGAGRFLRLLATANLHLLPIGIFEDRGALHLKLGRACSPFRLQQMASANDDLPWAEVVMRAIAACLPPEMRGAYV
jgi:hypothetical protein